jgi:hypothetical protein
MRTTSLKSLLGAMLGIGFVMAITAPAQARDDHEWREHMHYAHGWHHPHPHVIYPPAPVIYAPPPVVYAPPPQPVGINLILPLNFR